MTEELGRDKTPRQISGMFDAIAHRYDLLNLILSAGIDRRWRRAAIRALDLKGDETVLDLCTGTADLALAAASAVPRVQRVIGLDFAWGMLERGAQKVLQRGENSRMALVQGDATSLPVADGAIDAATIAFGIRNVARLDDTLAEVCRCLVPGGRFVILEFGQPTAPVIRPLYLWYLRRVLPLVGRFVSGHGSAYEYLPASVRVFPSPGELAARLTRAGFDEVRADRLTLGVVYLYSARKPVLP
ncbi:MAG: bifunctional demethylmenaquinone methyltransferase/2-methoxy-6-polyprenyl-1,4-benzoquinol methylase UbiE [Acidobacteriota bacterium]